MFEFGQIVTYKFNPVVTNKEIIIVGILSEIVQDNKFTAEDVPKFEAKLFFEGAKRRQYRERFTVLLFLAAVIATMGVISNSTATVIGAMIIAPLMTPIMATTAALLMWQPKRATHATMLVVAGVVGVIILSWLFGAFYLFIGRVISFETNPQITGRISPTGLDLVAALASGAAGAFAMSRDDISDSLAGVAISISLVPPLCVVGISLAGGEIGAASGSFLLFMTNYLSILLAGGGVLALLGLGRVTVGEMKGNSRRNAYIAITVAVLIVTIPLVITGTRIATQSIVQQKANVLAQAWVSETTYDLQDLRIDILTNKIDILISGDGEAPPLSRLGTELEKAFGKPVNVELEKVPSTRELYPEAAPKD